MTHALRLAALALLATAAFACRGSSDPTIPPAPISDGTYTLAVAPAADDRRSDGLYAYTAPGELPRVFVAGEEDGAELPLRHTDVDARVRGHVAEVLVTQSFQNDRREAIEVTYTFPLPENAAVDDMRMVVGDRVIQTDVQTRARARQTYEKARSDGHTAALLEQERPNIFTQSVTNIAPGETIEVELSYLQTLSQDAGTYEFVFPMVVGPRFSPGDDAVPDAARITPPVLGEGRRSGGDVSLTLDVEAGASISSVDAPTHTVTTVATARGFAARLADAETIPNRDFVIRWQAADATPRATLFLGPRDPKSGRGHFTLLIQPPQLDVDALVGRREMIFVVDRSGSMWGTPLWLAKQTLREALDRLRPVDTFDVVGFESGTERLFGQPRPANEHNLVLAERFIDNMEAGGGTMMADAVEAALAPRIAQGRHRYVFFLTDGFIGNETEIFAGAAQLVRRAEQAGARARVFGLGIGSAPNRELIAGLSEAGDGVPLYVGNREHPRAAVEDYYRYVDHPVLDDLRVDWGGLQVDEVYPGDLPNLFASHAVVVVGRYAGEVRGDLELQARVAGSGDPITLAIAVSPSDADGRSLATLWAREKIADLTAATWDAQLEPDEAERAITALGLDYHLVTAYTSFVAVDTSRVVGDGDPNRIVQPVEVPEDVDATMAGSNIVGGISTARDFTAVVSASPSFGTVGVSLAGTTAAQAAYTVEGANVAEPSVVVRRELELEREYTQAGSMASSPRGDWEPRAKLSITELELGEGGSAKLIKQALRKRARMFEACYEQRSPDAGKVRLRYRLSFDASGLLLLAELLGGSLGSEHADACIEIVLAGVTWAGLPPGETELELELRLQRR